MFEDTPTPQRFWPGKVRNTDELNHTKHINAMEDCRRIMFSTQHDHVRSASRSTAEFDDSSFQAVSTLTLTNQPASSCGTRSFSVTRVQRYGLCSGLEESPADPISDGCIDVLHAANNKRNVLRAVIDSPLLRCTDGPSQHGCVKNQLHCHRHQ